LTPIGPLEIIHKLAFRLKGTTPTQQQQQLQQQHQQSKKENRIVTGTYEVCKNIVRVVVKYSWCHVTLDMKIASSKDKLFSELYIIKHQTWTSRSSHIHDHRCFSINENHPFDVTEYDIPSEPFRFLLDNRL
jgi:hypothetical protein